MDTDVDVIASPADDVTPTGNRRYDTVVVCRDGIMASDSTASSTDSVMDCHCMSCHVM